MPQLMSILMVLLIWGAIVPAAGAGERQASGPNGSCAAPASRAGFDAFFDAMVGEWDVSIRDFDEQGTATPEARQRRTFSRAVGNRYVEERAFITRPSGESAHVGLMLFSLDEDRGVVLFVSFWPRSPRRWAELEGCLTTGDAPRLEGTMRSYRPGEPERVRRVEIRVESPDRMRWRWHGRTAEGREFLAEELVYSRVVPDGGS